MQPEFDDETPVNPFDPIAGANFKLKIRKVDGYTNYDKSEFADPSAVGDDDEISEVLEKTYDVQQLIAADKFRSYEEQDRRLNQVLGNVAVQSAPQRAAAKIDEEVEDDVPFETTPTKTKAVESAPKTTDDDDDALDYFRKLAADD